jgi:Protein kinase domain
VTLSAGTRLGPYEVLSPLGAGGMGEVFKAKDMRLDRFVAVKVLPEQLAKNDEALARFEREAKAVASLNHPNILGIHDFATQGETSYVVMELLEGESLRMRLERGPLTPRKATELAIQMAEGLAAAHEKGVVHRDLKPDNLWITKEGRLKILDFGLAKQVGAMGARSDSYAPTAALSPGHQTDHGMILGTLGYMSPEQVRGEAVDARADIFSFGVVLFEMLTGKRAFARDTASDTLAAILRDDPPEMEGTSRPIPPGLQRILHHCLEKRPEQRFHSAHDLAFALHNLSTAEGSARLAAPFAPQNRRTTWIWAALAAVLFVGAGFAGWALRSGPAPLPTFRPLTHERGTLSAARFVPNSPEVIYSAQWAGGASQWYSRRLDQSGTRPLPGSEGILLSVSATGEGIGLARPYLSHGVQVGSLFGLPLAGDAQREWVSSGVWGVRRGDPPRMAPGAEPAQSLGLGQRQSTISADGKWVVTCTLEPAFSVVIIPTGVGMTRRFPIPDFAGNDLRVDLLPDGKTAMVWGRLHQEATAFYALDLDSGNVRKITLPGTSPFAYQTLLSPDGGWLAYVHANGQAKNGELPIEISRPDGTGTRAVLSLPRGEAISGWGPNSSSLMVWDRNKLPAEVDRVDLATGRRTRVLTVLPADPVGIPGIQGLQITPDARAYTYNVTRKLSELYLVEGLK